MSETNAERYRRYAREAELRAENAHEAARIWRVAADKEQERDNA